MKYAIISDLHANIEALASVLTHLEKERVDEVICLGDLVGYHANPNECIELVRERGIKCITGNHDRAAAGLKRPLSFGYIGRQAIQWTRACLDQKNRQFLAELPVTFEIGGAFMAVHGALHPHPNEDLHLSTPTRVIESLRSLASGAFGTRLCFFGHTHRPAVYEYKSGGVNVLRPERAHLDPRFHYLINPGSVGQPRDGSELASYTVFDSDALEVRFHRVPFDRGACLRKALAAGLLKQPTPSKASWFWATNHADAALNLAVRGSRRLAQAALSRTARKS